MCRVSFWLAVLGQALLVVPTESRVPAGPRILVVGPLLVGPRVPVVGLRALVVGPRVLLVGPQVLPGVLLGQVAS